MKITHGNPPRYLKPNRYYPNKQPPPKPLPKTYRIKQIYRRRST